MSRYIPIAIIRIEHTYYDSFMNRNVILEPTSDTRKLMRQRGVMFVPTGTNEWQWAMPDDAPGFMDDDVLEVSMRVKDPYFLQQIESKGYEPGSFYLFSIENGVVEVNADYVWKKETEEPSRCIPGMVPSKYPYRRRGTSWLPGTDILCWTETESASS